MFNYLVVRQIPYRKVHVLDYMSQLLVTLTERGLKFES